MPIPEQLALWQSEANRLHNPIRWLPFWRPKVICKRGFVSPWFWPTLWLTRTGAFNLFLLLIVSDDLLDCPPRHRRAIIAHECGHLRGLHSLVWVGLLVVLLKTQAVLAGFEMIARATSPSVALAALLVFLLGLILGLKALLYWFEYQADDFAVSRVGHADVQAALEWLLEFRPALRASPWLAARIRRLQRTPEQAKGCSS